MKGLWHIECRDFLKVHVTWMASCYSMECRDPIYYIFFEDIFYNIYDNKSHYYREEEVQYTQTTWTESLMLTTDGTRGIQR